MPDTSHAETNPVVDDEVSQPDDRDARHSAHSAAAIEAAYILEAVGR